MTFAQYSHPEDRPAAPPPAAPLAPARCIHLLVGPHEGPACRAALNLEKTLAARHPDVIVTNRREDLARAGDRSLTIVYCAEARPVRGGFILRFHDGSTGIVGVRSLRGIWPVAGAQGGAS